MKNEEFDFILMDRIAKIKAINEQYDLEHNSYIAFSGGKDSTILHYLIDIALPNNHIPRVYTNTGIEFKDVRLYVQDLANSDDRIIILNQTKNIKQTLEKYGYPFKSKVYSHNLSIYQHKGEDSKIYQRILADKNSRYSPPNILKYQWNKGFKIKISDQCCYKLKKELAEKYAKGVNKNICITGMRSEEGGSRENLGCTIFRKDNSLRKFHPLIVCSEEWENMFLDIYNIKLCKLYYPPYNFERTGCKGCPYALNLEKDLLTMKRLLPNEYKQCMKLWKPVYDEYNRIGYRLSYKHLENEQLTIFDFIEEEGE